MGLKLFLIRHGETPLNSERRIQGSSSDPGLSERGKRQAERVGLALREERLSAIYCSPLKRAQQTAQAISPYHSLPISLEPALKEIDAGLIEGLSMEEVKSQHSDFFQEWRAGQGELRLPGGESLAELQERVWGAFQGIVQRHPEGAVAVVGHAFVLVTLVCRALDLSLPSFRRFHLDAAGISVLSWKEERASLTKFNDTCHLQEHHR